MGQALSPSTNMMDANKEDDYGNDDDDDGKLDKNAPCQMQTQQSVSSSLPSGSSTDTNPVDE